MLFITLLVVAQAPVFAQDQTSNTYSNMLLSGYEHSQKNLTKGHWIVDAANLETDIPEQGRSLFDIVFDSGQPIFSNYKIPFPFEKLIQKLENHLETVDKLVKRVQIPIGRSLRREAAAPDYFESPRIVIATDSEPKLINGLAGLNFKGRLFLGYQQNSKLIEVISYNPEAGRFEFQEVYDYGEGLQPKVRFAKRILCLSCHQNAGPIFSKEPWLETDSNQKIKSRLPTTTDNSKYLPRFDNAWAIDYATDRANYFSSSQFIWRQGCASDKKLTKSDAIQCRAAMLKAIFQYRLLGFVDENTMNFQRWFLPQIRRNWSEKWPNGLLIATADLPDKDPFINTMNASQDPLNLRRPRAKWLNPSPNLLAGIIYQTAEFLTEPDIFQIDQYLQQQAKLKQVPQQRFQSYCKLDRGADIGSRQYIKFACDNDNKSSSLQFTAMGSFEMNNNRILRGHIDSLDIPDLTTSLRFLDLGEAVVERNSDFIRVTVPIRKHKTRLGARLIDGTLLKQLEFQWPANPKQVNELIDQQAYLTTVNDIKPLYLAIDGMVEKNKAGISDSLSSKPFRRHTIVQSLHRNLEMPALIWGQYHFTSNNDNRITPNPKPVSSLLPFFQNCSACHVNQDNFPPGFLNGTILEIKQHIRQCAQKILVRLNMWNHNSKDRPISPMPPLSWVSAAGMTESQWLNSAALNDMQAIVRLLLANNSQKPPQLSHTSTICL